MISKPPLIEDVVSSKSRLRVLHLEDDPHDSELVKSLLAEQDIVCDLLRVETSADFLAAVQEGKLDIILADYALPSFDGMSALAMVLENCPHVPFILLSGTAGEELAAESVKSGATDYVLKDRPSRLVPSVRRALREAEERRELKRAEESLRASEERLRTVIQHMPALMAAFDEGGNIIVWNRECERVTGYRAGEIVGIPKALELLYPGHTPQQWMMTEWSRPNEDFRDRESQLTTRDGQIRIISWSNISRSFPVPDWSGWVIGIDVTESKRAQAEREQMQRKLLQTQKLESLGVLAGGIAHDFNNLLTGIMGNSGLALSRLEPDNQVRELIERVMQASERAAELTRQMLAYAGKASFEIRPIDLSDHIRENAHHLTATVSKKVSFRFELGEGLPAVDVDPAQVQQLVMNLMINAAEACGDNPGSVVIRTGVIEIGEEHAEEVIVGESLRPGPYVYLEVKDNGYGMDEQTLAKIFDPFFTTKFAGRGLGLSTVLGIVRAHQGGLRVSSAPGQGSSFTVFLPPSSKAAEARVRESPADLSGKGLILVVDDELVVLEVARKILEGHGYEVLVAENGQQAVEIFRERSPDIDIVLLDMTMPDMNGEETFQAMRAIRRDVVAILSSGYNQTEVTPRFEGKGLGGFIQKPYSPRVLAARVMEVLRTTSKQARRGQAQG